MHSLKLAITILLSKSLWLVLFIVFPIKGSKLLVLSYTAISQMYHPIVFHELFKNIYIIYIYYTCTYPYFANLTLCLAPRRHLVAPFCDAGAFSATQQSPGDAAKRGRVCTGAAGAGCREAGLGSAFKNPKGNGFGDPYKVVPAFDS